MSDMKTTESPVVIRTRHYGEYINIQDLQLQLYRDKDLVDSYETRQYVEGLIKRLNKLKEI